MPTAKKSEAVVDLTSRLRLSRAVVLTDYRGLPTSELNALRARLKEAGGEYHVVKNTLLEIAAKRVGIKGLEPILEGPTAMAISHERDVELARAVVDYIRSTRTPLAIKGGVLCGEALTTAKVEELAALPTKPDLQARLAGSIQGPLAGFVGLLNSALGELVTVLQERQKQLAPAGG